MSVETKPETARASMSEGVRDFMLPPNTARPYRILTCVSKAGEVVWVLGGMVAGIATKNPTLIAEGSMGVIPWSFNIGLDEGVGRRNANKDKPSNKGR
jgi:hypothetical protein